MTLDSALERVSDLADRLERSNPNLTRPAVTEARLFVMTIRDVAAGGVDSNDLLTDTLQACKHLERLLSACQTSRFQTAKRMVA